MAVVLVIASGVTLVWLLVPYTPQTGVVSLTSKLGTKYFAASLVAFFGLLAYGASRKSRRIFLLGIASGIVGIITLFGF
ncbi:MAG TPA: hypothetical protein VGR53_10945 [Nitrososphaerales archaeon]|nr:hypothetical protein [Nitrososphaerales archaeon]